jgi:hypothetical protein
MEPTLRALLSRRPFSLALWLSMTLIALTARSVMGLTLPRLFDPPILVAGLGLIIWCAAELARRRREMATLEREASALRVSLQAFARRTQAWLTGTGDDEPEAEALRDALLRRHRALTAAARCTLAHREPAEDTDLLAHTTPLERGSHRGQTLLGVIAGLQRDGLAEARRRGFLGEHEALALEDAPARLETLTPLPADPAPTDRLLSTLVGVYAAVLPASCSQRMTTAAMGAFAGLVLLLFEALATAPVRLRDDPRRAVLDRAS